jgi:hypothetical protein
MGPTEGRGPGLLEQSITDKTYTLGSSFGTAWYAISSVDEEGGVSKILLPL